MKFIQIYFSEITIFNYLVKLKKNCYFSLFIKEKIIISILIEKIKMVRVNLLLKYHYGDKHMEGVTNVQNQLNSVIWIKLYTFSKI